MLYDDVRRSEARQDRMKAFDWRDLSKALHEDLSRYPVALEPMIIEDSSAAAGVVVSKSRWQGIEIWILAAHGHAAAVELGYTLHPYNGWAMRVHDERPAWLAEQLALAVGFVAGFDLSTLNVTRLRGEDPDALDRRLITYTVRHAFRGHLGRTMIRSGDMRALLPGLGNPVLDLPETHRWDIDRLRSAPITSHGLHGFGRTTLSNLYNAGITTYADFVGTFVDDFDKGRTTAYVARPDGTMSQVQGIGQDRAWWLASGRMSAQAHIRDWAGR